MTRDNDFSVRTGLTEWFEETRARIGLGSPLPVRDEKTRVSVWAVEKGKESENAEEDGISALEVINLAAVVVPADQNVAVTQIQVGQDSKGRQSTEVIPAIVVESSGQEPAVAAHNVSQAVGDDGEEEITDVEQGLGLDEGGGSEETDKIEIEVFALPPTTADKIAVAVL